MKMKRIKNVWNIEQISIIQFNWSAKTKDRQNITLNTIHYVLGFLFTWTAQSEATFCNAIFNFSYFSRNKSHINLSC